MTATATAKFDQILKLEDRVKGWKVSAAFGTYSWDRDRANDQLAKDKRRLFAAIDALTPAEAAEFGRYRLEATR